MLLAKCEALITLFGTIYSKIMGVYMGRFFAFEPCLVQHWSQRVSNITLKLFELGNISFVLKCKLPFSNLQNYL